LTGRE